MGSILSKEMIFLTLCLITLFSTISCANTQVRSVAEENSVNRAPPGSDGFSSNKVIRRQFVNERN